MSGDGTDPMTPADVVTAERVEVVDDRGRAGVVITGDGVRLYHRSGCVRAALALTASGPQLTLFHEELPAILVGVGDEGADRPGAFLVLCDQHGQPAAGYHVAPDGSIEQVGAVDDEFDG